MKVRLTQKLSELINGVDLSKAHAGDTLDLTEKDARTLIAEGWAVYETGEQGPDRAHDKARGKRAPGRSKKKR
jgi:hypothetical protein